MKLLDVEGLEYEVIKGAKKTSPRMIQFEFNSMDVYFRIFLKDFYDLLPNYDFYRISPKELIPLGEYNTINEIFAYQNILCIKK